MRVLIIEHFLPSNTYSKELCESLSEYCDITVLTKRNYIDDGKVNWEVKPCLFQQDLKNKVLSFVYVVLGWMHIVKELLFGKYDIVHVQTFKVDTVEMFLYRLLARGRLVHTAHNILPHEASNKDRRKYGRFYGKCECIIVHNEVCKQLLTQEYGVGDKVRVIPHGTYRAKIVNCNKKSDKINILQFGMIRKYKGIDILIKAVGMLSEEVRRKIHVTIAGKQYKALDDSDYQTMISDLGISDTISFKSERIADSEMSILFSQADVCVFPYRQIYGSGALLMAYSYEKPVIVSSVPALIEETQNGATGLIFSSEDSSALAQAIEEFVNKTDKDIIAYKNNVRRLTSQKYNWIKSAELTYKAYKEISQE